MIRFALLPYKSYNDFEDLSNDDFLERIRDPIDDEEIAVTYPQGSGDGLTFISVRDSLAISYDGGVIYEPQTNKTVVKVVIVHEKGYSPGEWFRET